MIRSLATLALLTGLTCTSSAQPGAGTLAIDVVASDRSGQAITDLRPSDFELWIGGYRVPVQDVSYVTPDTQPRTLIVLLDNVAVGLDMALRIKEAARAVLNAAGPEDRIALVPVHGSPVDASGGRARLLQAIEAYHPQGFQFRIEDAGQHVLTLLTALSREQIERPGRKVMIGIGAGWMFDTPLPPPGLRNLHAEWITAMRTMAAARASLYVIDPAGLRVAGGAAFGGESGFANQTGGYAFVQTNDMTEAARRVVSEAGTYYVLRAADPPVQRTAQLRRVEVKVQRDGVTLRVRRGIPGGAL